MTNYYKENKYIKENFERKYFSTSLRHGYADAGDVVWQKKVGYRDCYREVQRLLVQTAHLHIYLAFKMYIFLTVIFLM